MPKISKAERERKRDEKYGVSATITVGPSFTFEMAFGSFDISAPERLGKFRCIEAVGELSVEHPKMPPRANVTITERDDLLTSPIEKQSPHVGRYSKHRGEMRTELWVLPPDLMAIGGAVGRATLDIHMVIDPPIRGGGKVRSSFFKLQPVG